MHCSMRTAACRIALRAMENVTRVVIGCSRFNLLLFSHQNFGSDRRVRANEVIL